MSGTLIYQYFTKTIKPLAELDYTFEVFLEQFKDYYEEGMCCRKVSKELKYSRDNIVMDFFIRKSTVNKACRKCSLEFKWTELNGDMVCPTCVKNRIDSIQECKICAAPLINKGRHSGFCQTHWSIHRVITSLVSSSKYRAKLNNLEHDLDYEWAKERVHFCEATGIKLEIRDCKTISKNNYANRNPRTPTIDKIDPKKGYTKDNCRVVCWWYNLAKSYYSDETVLELMALTVKFNEEV